MYEKFKQYKNYAIISLISLICLFILPLTTSTVGLAFTFPNTVAGWVVFVFNKLLVATVNLLILYCFTAQGKFNVRNDPAYVKARELMMISDIEKAEIPDSPSQHYAKIYGKKGISLFITTVLASISLTQAVLAFDLATFISYGITLVIGIIFGVIQMGIEECWWTEEFPRWVKLQLKNNENHNENTIEN